MKTQKKKMKWQKKLVIIVAAVLLLAVIVGAGGGIAVYEMFFGVRYETYAPTAYKTEDFEGLLCADYEFTSDKGQTLAAYLYHTGKGSPKGLIVFAHGFGGGGHNSYMDIINLFAQNGYYVFTYDATANDNSEGDSVGGLPQGVIDLENALDFVKLQKEFYHLPIMLIGHSWGGYSVTNVLKYHPDVKAVCSLAGFNTSLDLIMAQGETLAGKTAIKLLMPVLSAYESIRFGEYSENTAMEGFALSDARVMVVHSADDTTVPKKYGYDIWYETYKDDPRFTFIEYADKGHNSFLNSDEGLEYSEAFNEALNEYIEGLPEDLSEEAVAELKAEYIEENLDREKWANGVNEELFGEVLSFFNAAVQ